jgi:hypothetical protein
MPRFIYLALSDPQPGREMELDAWYDEVHLAQVVDVPGFVSAQRFAAVEAGDGPVQRRRILVIYEIEADDPAQVIAALRKLRGTDRLIPCDALDPRSMFAQAYRPAGAMLHKDGAGVIGGAS